MSYNESAAIDLAKVIYNKHQISIKENNISWPC